jgi:hypothetical protein
MRIYWDREDHPWRRQKPIEIAAPILGRIRSRPRFCDESTVSRKHEPELAALRAAAGPCAAIARRADSASCG